MKPSLAMWRRLSQAAAAIAFIIIPILNARGSLLISGNLISLDFFGLTFVDPLAFLQTLAGGPPTAKAATGAALVLVMALILGRVFCGWVCPYGLASELVLALRGRRKTQISPAAGGGLRPLAVRSAVAGLGLLIALLFLPEPWLNQFSMPGWYSKVFQLAVFSGAPPFGALIFPALLILEGFIGKRVWCRYLCPQSVSLALAAHCLPRGFGVKWSPGRCSCRGSALPPCQTACSLGLTARQANGPPRSECFQCAECVSICAKHGAALKLGGVDRVTEAHIQ